MSPGAAVLPIRHTRPSGRPYNRSWRANGAATHVGGAATVISPAHWAACTGGAPTGARRLAAAPRRARRLRRLPAGLSLSPLGQIAEASRRANQRIDVAASTVAGVARRCPTRPSERTHRRSWWTDRAARPVGRVAAVRFPAWSSIAPAAGNRMAPKLPNAPPGWPSLPRRAPGGIFPFRLNDDQSAANTPGDVAPPSGPPLIRPRRRRPRERRLRDGHLGVLAGAPPPRPPAAGFTRPSNVHATPAGRLREGDALAELP